MFLGKTLYSHSASPHATETGDKRQPDERSRLVADLTLPVIDQMHKCQPKKFFLCANSTH